MVSLGAWAVLQFGLRSDLDSANAERWRFGERFLERVMGGGGALTYMTAEGKNA